MSAEPEIARDDSFNVKEALAALEFHMAKAAKRGDYGCHSDLSQVADLIESLQAILDDLEEGRPALPMELVFYSPYEQPDARPVPQFREEE